MSIKISQSPSWRLEIACFHKPHLHNNNKKQKNSYVWEAGLSYSHFSRWRGIITVTVRTLSQEWGFSVWRNGWQVECVAAKPRWLERPSWSPEATLGLAKKRLWTWLEGVSDICGFYSLDFNYLISCETYENCCRVNRREGHSGL